MARPERGWRAVPGGVATLFGGSSVVTSGGGLIAQVEGHASTLVVLGIYGSATLVAVVGAMTAIVKILAERSPEIRRASAMAKIATQMTRRDGGRLLILDRCLDKGDSVDQVLKALTEPSLGADQGRDADQSRSEGEPGRDAIGGANHETEAHALGPSDSGLSRPVLIKS
jgi:hypothetical protein